VEGFVHQAVRRRLARGSHRRREHVSHGAAGCDYRGDSRFLGTRNFSLREVATSDGESAARCVWKAARGRAALRKRLARKCAGGRGVRGVLAALSTRVAAG
jgi:hypothetical protein